MPDGGEGMQGYLIPEMGAEYIQRSVERVKTAWQFHQHMNPDGKPMLLAFSGGKDSTSLFFICKKAAEQLGIPMERMCHVRYNVTNIDPPEVVHHIRYMKSIYPFIEIMHPEKTMWEIIREERIPPTRQTRYCCRLIKEERGIVGGYTLTGVRRAESKSRSNRRGFETSAKYKRDRILLNDNGDDRRASEYCMQKQMYICNPIIDWSEDDVWNFIRSENLPYCKLYDEGWERVGCIGCPLTWDKYRKRQFERWPGYKAQYIRTFDKVVKDIHRDIEEGKPWNYEWEVFRDGQDMFDWWMHDPIFWQRRGGKAEDFFKEEEEEDVELIKKGLDEVEVGHILKDIKTRVMELSIQCRDLCHDIDQLIGQVSPSVAYGQLTIDELGFSTRTVNCLKHGGILTVGKLIEKRTDELMEIRYFGQSCLYEVRDRLKGLGLCLANEVDNQSKGELVPPQTI